MRDDGFIYGGGFVGPDFAILRLEPEGDLDTSFSPGGVAGIETTDFFTDPAIATAMTLQSTGKPVLAGSVNDDTFNQGDNFALARYYGSN